MFSQNFWCLTKRRAYPTSTDCDSSCPRCWPTVYNSKDCDKWGYIIWDPDINPDMEQLKQKKCVFAGSITLICNIKKNIVQKVQVQGICVKDTGVKMVN